MTRTGLGLGCAALGNLYRAVTDEVAAATVEAAWTAGIRYFDTAPHYGLGLSEQRLGRALRGRPRDVYTVSTKVGRLLVPDPAGAGRPDPEGFVVPATHRRVRDFSRDGVRRCLDQSLERLGLDRIDLVLLHDPEGHDRAALDEAYPALAQLRAAGVVGTIGVGSKDPGILQRFVTQTDVDTILLAGRYTLLEQPALDELLPACLDRNVQVINAGVFNSGLLAVADPHEGLPYEYGPASDGVLRRARALAGVCTRHGSSLPAAALAFAGGHPAVACVLLGAQTPEELIRNVALFRCPPPAALWADTVAAGLLRPDAPLPSADHEGEPAC